jgi:hypothetical protein
LCSSVNRLRWTRTQNGHTRDTFLDALSDDDRLIAVADSNRFILVPHLTPGGLDRFADEVVPRLQERGAFRSDYAGTTLREHLGLAPVH